MTSALKIAPEVASALAEGAPVVALESTVITHGMPRPLNLEIAQEMQNVIRQEGAVPATLGLLDGKAHVGLDKDQLASLASNQEARKVSLRDLPSAVAGGWSGATAALLLILISWFVVLLVENCRIPFDDPNTHLELTMIHEVMVLDHSGPAFGLILYGAAMKLFVFAALIVRLAVPVQTGSAIADWIVFLTGTVVVATVIGTVESVMARLKLPSIPSLLMGAGVLSLFSLILVLVQA